MIQITCTCLHCTEKTTTSSASLATKLGMPLSSLQRRRAELEKSVLIKAYHINLKASGGKIGDIVINVGKGRSRVATNILKNIKASLCRFLRTSFGTHISILRVGFSPKASPTYTKMSRH